MIKRLFVKLQPAMQNRIYSTQQPLTNFSKPIKLHSSPDSSNGYHNPSQLNTSKLLAEHELSHISCHCT